jgi:hypothetical protein
MPTSAFNGLPEDDDAQEQDQALEDFVWDYRRCVSDIIREFLDGRLDQGPEREALEAKTLEIFETRAPRSPPS